MEDEAPHIPESGLEWFRPSVISSRLGRTCSRILPQQTRDGYPEIHATGARMCGPSRIALSGVLEVDGRPFGHPKQLARRRGETEGYAPVMTPGRRFGQEWYWRPCYEPITTDVDSVFIGKYGVSDDVVVSPVGFLRLGWRGFGRGW